MEGDPLSEVLATVRVYGSVTCRLELSAPWGLSLRGDDLVFHAVRRGSCWLRFDGSRELRPDAVQALRLDAGDIALLPRSCAHTLGDTRAGASVELCTLLSRLPPEHRGPLVHGGGGAQVALLSGRFLGDQAAQPLLSMLPRVLLIRGQSGRADASLEATLELLASESAAARRGADAVIARAADALFVQAVRAYLDGASASPGAYLRGLSDRRIATALAAIHRLPAERWTVHQLAAVAAMSRSTFCERFRELVGESPHRYLTRWRIQSAAAILRSKQSSLAELAEQAGFLDETAFSRAFKRHLGMSPRAYRRLQAVRGVSPVGGGGVPAGHGIATLSGGAPSERAQGAPSW